MPWQPAIDKKTKAIRRNFIKEGKGNSLGKYSLNYPNQYNTAVKNYIKKNPSVKRGFV